MKITAITKFKQGDLWAVLRKLGWNQAELARRSGLHVTRIGEYINLKRRPTAENANAIQNAFAEAGEYVDVSAIWPETFRGLKRSLSIEQTRDVEIVSLVDAENEVLALAAAEETNEVLEERLKALNEAFDGASPRNQEIIKRFMQEVPIYRIRREFKLTRARLHQIKDGFASEVTTQIAKKKAREAREVFIK